MAHFHIARSHEPRWYSTPAGMQHAFAKDVSHEEGTTERFLFPYVVSVLPLIGTLERSYQHIPYHECQKTSLQSY